MEELEIQQLRSRALQVDHPCQRHDPWVPSTLRLSRVGENKWLPAVGRCLRGRRGETLLGENTARLGLCHTCTPSERERGHICFEPPVNDRLELPVLSLPAFVQARCSWIQQALRRVAINPGAPRA